MRDAEPATWLLVRISPSGATTTPDPVPPRDRASGLSSGWLGVDGEADHGRADTIDHVDDGARIGIEERLVLDRDGGVFAGGGPAAAPVGIG